jgi:hypothetical protein
MNILEFLLSVFHDAHQDLSPVDEPGATPASAVDSMAVENTPIRQQRLFSGASNWQATKN